MTLSRAAFARAVRRLDGDDARGLVADLLDARGYRTTVDGDVVTATTDADVRAGTGPSTRVRVVGGFRAVATAPADGADVVLVTGGPIARALGSVALRSRTRGAAGDPTRSGVETLYEWFAFAVDGETRATLEERYLGRTDPSALERVWTALGVAAAGLDRRLDRFQTPSRRATGAVLLALFALVAVTTVGPSGLLAPPGSSGSTGAATTDGATPTPSRVTPVPATPTPVATSTSAGPPLPDVCPPAPTGEHPASLRPAVRQTATAGGLDGWRLLLTQNISEYEFDPNDQTAGAVPQERHVAVFETSGGRQIRLGLDRWASPARARAAMERGGPWGLGFPWGAYTVWAEWDARSAGTDAFARLLLGAVTTPAGIRVGGACVSALATGPATDGGPGSGDTDGTTTTPHVSGQSRGGWTPRLPRTGPPAADRR